MRKTLLLGAYLFLAALGADCLVALPSYGQQVSFTCTVDTDNIPTTYAQTPEGAMPVFKWTSTFFKPPYTPMQRCQEVSERMNKFYSQGQLDSLTSGIVNKLPVICAGSGCNADGNNVLITLKPNQNPNQVLEELDSNRSGVAGASMQLGSNSSINQNADGTVTLDLNKFLDRQSATIPRTPSNPSFQTPAPTGGVRSW